MPPPSPLSIATSSVVRLVKEEASYHKELQQQEANIKKLQLRHEAGQDEDENAEFMIRQEKRAVEETKAVFPSLRERIADAVAKLESRLEEVKEGGKEVNVQEITKAKQAIADAETGHREIA